MSKFFLKQEVKSDAIKQGKISGVAYSGGVIPDFSFYKNFIIDLDSLVIAKDKTVILKDHNSTKVIGHGNITLQNNALHIEGNLSKKVQDALDIISLSEDGVDWELSVGIYGGTVSENYKGEVNGLNVSGASVLKNGVLREVSIVAIGADINTSLNILSATKEIGVDKFKKLKKVLKLAADAEIEQVEERVEEILIEVEKAASEVEEVKSEVDERDSLIESLKTEIEKLKKELESLKNEKDSIEREEEIEASLKSSGVEMSAEKIKTISLSKEATDNFLDTLKAMKFSKVIDEKFLGKDEHKGGQPTNNAVELQSQANELVKTGAAKDFISALTIINGGK